MQNHAVIADSKLRFAGYDGDFKRDGKRLTMGLYYRTSTFAKIHVGFVTFDKPQYSVLASTAAVDTDISEYGSQKGAVLALLRHRDSRKHVLLASVHLDVPRDSRGCLSTKQQLASVDQLFTKVRGLLQHPSNRKVLGDTPLTTPVVICGDFNSVPTAVESGEVADPDVYHRMMNDASFSVDSAYRAVLGDEPCFTSVKPSFVHTIDYIFYTKAVLQPSYVLDVVDCRQDGSAMPKIQWPSDHLPLVCSFQFLQGREPTEAFEKKKTSEHSKHPSSSTLEYA